MRCVLAITLAWACVVRGVTAQSEPGWHDEQTIEIDGAIRYFRYLVPSVVPVEPPPLVILLHGGNSSMRDAIADSPSGAWADVAEAAGFILVVPNGTNAETGDAAGDRQNWNDCRADAGEADVQVDDVGYITALMTWSEANLGTDSDRTYVTGSSNGGLMGFRLAQEASGRVAAAATFIANLPADSECRADGRPVPIMITVGTADPLMPFAGGQVAGDRGPVLSAPQTVAYWTGLNRIDGPPAHSVLPDNDPGDGSIITRHDYVNAVNGMRVRYLRMDGAGHAPPSTTRFLTPLLDQLIGPQNRDIEGAAAAWAFLQSSRRSLLFAAGFE